MQTIPSSEGGLSCGDCRSTKDQIYGILVNVGGGGKPEPPMIMGRILVVEDEEHVRRTVGLALKQGGYEVIEAIDGEQAIQNIQAKTQTQPVNAIICDLALPKLSGEEVIRYLRAKLPSVPIIVLTGHPDVQSATSLFKQGVVDYLVKPAQAQTLLDSVRRAINEQALSG